MRQINTYVFDNGLPLVYFPHPYSKVWNAILLVGTGSRFETLENQGVSRFYTNICFQGSQTHPDKNQLDQALDQLGVNIFSSVYPEYTLFYFSSVEKRFLNSFQLFWEIFFQPALTEKGLEKEKKLTLSEVKTLSQNPQILGLNKLSSVVFNNTSLGFDILGTKESIQQINLEKLNEFKSKYYVSKNCLLIITGPEKDSFLAPLEKIVSLTPEGERQPLPLFDLSQTQTIEEKINKMGKTSHLTFGALCFGRSSSKRIAQTLLTNILISGKKNQRLKRLKKKKIVISIKPWIKTFSECSLFIVQAVTYPEKEKEAWEKISEQLKELGKETITEEELRTAKNYYESYFLTKLDNSLELGIFYNINYFFNLSEQTPEEFVQKLNQISVKEINETAQAIFQPENISSVTVGPGY